MSDRELDAERAPVIGVAIDALRAEVPVRAAWRERVLREAGALPTPRRSPLALIAAGRPAPEESVRTARVAPMSPMSWRRPRRATVIAAAVVVAASLAAGSAIVYSKRARNAPARMAESTTGVERGAAPGTASGMTAPAQAAAASGLERFSISAPGAARVSLVGDFNQWRPGITPLHRVDEGGSWEVRLALPPGRHVYAFVVDGKLVADPSAPRAGEDDFGFPNSVALIAVSN